jgi:hypothetical protein
MLIAGATLILSVHSVIVLRFSVIAILSRCSDDSRSTSIINTIYSDMVRDTFQIEVGDDIKIVKDVRFVEDIHKQLLDTSQAKYHRKLPSKIRS